MKSPRPWLALGLVVSLSTLPAADAPEVVTVVAEGAGTTPEAATKDAIRNAVRQVVGVLIDSETLVKNDDLISDRLIAASNGFVTKYEKLSEKKDGGLIRVRIKAVVEKGQVASRLKEAKVITTAVDGSSLAAEKMTKEEARKNAKALIAKQFVGFEKLLKAEVVGRPALDKEGSLVAQVIVGVDEDKYFAKIKDLEAVLDKVAAKKDTLLVTPQQGFGNKDFPIRSFGREFRFQHNGYKPEADLQASTIWVMNFADAKRTKLRWNVYRVDASLADAVKPLEGDYTLEVTLTDANGKTVGVEEMPLYSRGEWEPRRSSSRVHRTNVRDFDGWMLVSAWQGPGEYDPRYPVVIATAPFAFFSESWVVMQADRLPYVAKFKLTDAELARVKSATCRVVLKPFKDE